MYLTADYHTHTVYSDGQNTVAENARRAKELGLQQIAITDHGYSHWCFGMDHKNDNKLFEECRAAEEETGVRVLVGTESNIRGTSGKCDLSEEDFRNFDVYLCGIHVIVRYQTLKDYWHILFGNYVKSKLHVKPSKQLVRSTTEAYIRAIKKNPIDAVTHINYLCFADAVEVAKCCRDYGTYLELNSKKHHISDEDLVKVADTGVRFIIDSDAHSVERIGDTKLVEEQIKRVGLSTDLIDNIDGRLPQFRLAEYKRRHG